MRPLGPSDPETVGRYRLYAELGSGAMGRVLLAAAPDGQLAAFKQVRAHFVEDEGFRARFRREVSAARAVSGPHTAAVLDADADAELPWLASEFVSGVSLREAVHVTGELPEEPALRLAAGLAAALTAVHRAGLVHRGLKPADVLLTDDGLRVTDFGVARAAESDGGSALTHTGWLAGAVGFMSPEQIEGQRLTPRSDVFSLGAVLFAACTGRGPFAGPSTPQTLYNVVHTEPDLGMLPERLRDLVRPCLAKDPVRRPTSAQLLEQLDPAASSARPWPPPVHTLIARRREDVATLLQEAAAAPGDERTGAPTTGTRTRQSSAPDRGSAATTPAALPAGRPAPPSRTARPRWRRLLRAGLPAALAALLSAVVLWTLRPAPPGTDARPRPPTSSPGRPEPSPGDHESAPPPPVKQPVNLFGHTGFITDVAYSPDGRTLATSSSDGTARLWSVSGRRQLGRPLSHGSGAVNGVAFSPDGRTLATGGSDGTVRLWSVSGRRQLAGPLSAGSDPVAGVAFSPDGTTLAAGGDHGATQLWDVSARRQLGRPLQRQYYGKVNSVAFSPDGRTLATGESDGTARLWDVAGRRQLGRPLGPFIHVSGVAFSPDGRTLAVGAWDRTTRLWDVASQRQVAELRDSDIVSGIAFSPDGRTVATANTYHVRLWDASGHRRRGRIDSGAVTNPDCVAFSPDGRSLATGSGDNDGAVQLWDVSGFD